MDPGLLDWLKKNVGTQFVSPRRFAFGSKPQDIILEAVREDLKQVKILFSKRRSQALPLHFWMFDRVLSYLHEHKEAAFSIGAAVRPPYIEGSVEGEIWKESRPHGTPYRVSPFILDLLVLAGFTEYMKIRWPGSKKLLQGVQYKLGAPRIIVKPVVRDTPKPHDKKEEFLSKYREIIEAWTEANKYEIIKSRLNYTWQHKPRYECEQSRNKVSRAIIESRIKNDGAVDLETLDQILKWGFNTKYPNRDQKNALDVSREAFQHLNEGNLQQATTTLTKVYRVGIATASKIIGLYDQENLCIYDSRVGYALREMKHNGTRILLIPPPRDPEKERDAASNEVWAENYQYLIWIAEVMREYMNGQGCTYRLADIEMALFMMGK